MKLTPEQILENEKKVWTRSAPADLYYQRDISHPIVSKATPKLIGLLDKFQSEILDKASEARAAQPKYEPPKINRLTMAKCRPSRGCCGDKKVKREDDGGSSSSSEDEDDHKDSVKNETIEWLEHRAKQPFRLHEELWDNQSNELVRILYSLLYHFLVKSRNSYFRTMVQHAVAQLKLVKKALDMAFIKEKTYFPKLSLNLIAIMLTSCTTIALPYRHPPIFW